MATVRRSGKLRRMAAKANNGLRIGLIQSGKLVSQHATRIAPIKTGRLKRSIKEDKPYRVRRTGMAIDIGTNVSYAHAQEFGSGIHAEKGPKIPYEIWPKTKKALAFEWPNAPAGMEPNASGKFVFGKVMHQGVKAQPYLRPALRESTKEIRAILLNYVAEALRRS